MATERVHVSSYIFRKTLVVLTKNRGHRSLKAVK